MQDLIYGAIPVAFFALCVAYVRGLDRLVRAGGEGEPATEPAEARS